MTCGILRRFRHNARPVRRMTGEDAVVANHVKARRRHCRAKTHEQIFRLQHEAKAAVLPRLLEAQEERTVITAAEPLLRKRRTCDVPRQPLYLFSVETVDPLLAVQVNPANLRDRLIRQRLTHGLLLDISEHESELRLPCPVTADADSQRCGVVAGSQGGMLQLHLGRLGIALLGVQAPPVLLQNRVDAVGYAASNVFSLLTRGRRQVMKSELAAVVIRIRPNIDTIQAEDVELPRKRLGVPPA